MYLGNLLVWAKQPDIINKTKGTLMLNRAADIFLSVIFPPQKEEVKINKYTE